MENTEIIEKYLDGSLSDEERVAVEARADSDPEFRKLIEMHREVNKSIADNDLYELHKKIEAVTAEDAYQNWRRTGTWHGFRYYLLRIGALVLLVTGSAIIMRYAFNTHSPEERLLNRYYIPYDADVVSRSAQATGEFDNAMLSYSRKEYETAFSVFSVIVEDDPENYLAWFFRGLSCMELNDFENAARSFTSIPEPWNSVYSEHRDWYYGLTLLGQGNTRQASIVFGNISRLDGYYAGKARRIYSRLTR